MDLREFGFLLAVFERERFGWLNEAVLMSLAHVLAAIDSGPTRMPSFTDG